MRTNQITSLLALLVASSAITVFADPLPAPIKWSQLPDMVGGLDYSSELKLPSRVADDWLCQSPLPVTDIHWWGSYWLPGYSPNSDSLPNGPAGGIQSFTLSIWSDVPASGGAFSRPGQTLWTFTTSSFSEAFFGHTAAGQEVYQYNLYLPEANYFNQVPGTVYWLSIQADLPNTSVQWGWHESSQHWNDAAVQQFMGSSWYTLNNNLYSSDMAFELSVPEPGTLSLLALGGLAFLLRRRVA